MISGAYACENSGTPVGYSNDPCVSLPLFVDLGFDITAMAVDGADNLWVRPRIYFDLHVSHFVYAHFQSML